jgi:hypothetical protein
MPRAQAHVPSSQTRQRWNVDVVTLASQRMNAHVPSVQLDRKRYVSHSELTRTSEVVTIAKYCKYIGKQMIRV